MTFEVYERAGSLMVARDAGKPQGKLYRTSAQAPTFSDHRAPLEGYTIVGQLVGEGAYEDARVLAEDIVRPAAGGASATLDLSDVSGLGAKQVGFVGDRALSLGYPSNQGEWVSLQLTAVVVDNTIGGTTQGPGGVGDTGTGPVVISRDGASLSLAKNIDMERQVGRPETTTRHDGDNDPYMVDRPRAFSDVFELSATWNVDAAAKQNQLVEQIVKPPLGFGSMTLNFNGLYGLGTYTVAPVDSRATRVSWSAGEQGMVRVESLKLMVVDA